MSIDVQGGDRLVWDNVSASKMTEGQDCTWFGWFMPRTTGGLRNIHGQQSSGGKENIYRFNGNNFQGGSWGPDEYYNYVTTPADLAKMTLYIATYTGTWRTYVDGVFVGEDITSSNGPRNVTTAWAIGAQANGGRASDGFIADCRVYTRALSEAEILTAYTTRGADGIVDGLLWRLRLNEATPGAAGFTAKNQAELDFSVTPQNAPVYAEDTLRHRRRAA